MSRLRAATPSGSALIGTAVSDAATIFPASTRERRVTSSGPFWFAGSKMSRWLMFPQAPCM